MFLKELIPLLNNHPMGLYDIAQLLETSRGMQRMTFVISSKALNIPIIV